MFVSSCITVYVYYFVCRTSASSSQEHDTHVPVVDPPLESQVVDYSITQSPLMGDQTGGSCSHESLDQPILVDLDSPSEVNSYFEYIIMYIYIYIYSMPPM